MSQLQLNPATTAPPRCVSSPATPLEEINADVVVVPLSTERGGTRLSPMAPTADAGRLGELGEMMGLSECGAHAVIPSAAIGPWAASRVVLSNLGPVSTDDEYLSAVRVAVPAAIRAVRSTPAARVALPFARRGRSDPMLHRAIVESAILAAYSFDRYRSARPAVGELLFPGIAEAEIELGRIIGWATNLVRDLVNTPAVDLTPADLADWSVQQCSARGVPVRVLGEEDLARGRFGGLAAVGRASANPPRLVVIGEPADPARATALVGKGITFDSGGLSLKDAMPMLTMKCDMAGAAAVLGVALAAAEIGVADNLVGYLACAENAVSGTAYRPSDVLRHRNGMTTEVISTDAEGRLVLADVLAYAAESNPACIVDIATLTGATGLGPDLWGVMGNNAELVAALLRAGEASGEPGWELPLWNGYRTSLRSDVADLRNYDPDAQWGNGAILGALYLREFVGETPWAHLDIAATAFREKETAQWAAGATGSPVRTLVNWLLTMADGPAAPSGRD